MVTDVSRAVTTKGYFIRRRNAIKHSGHHAASEGADTAVPVTRLLEGPLRCSERVAESASFVRWLFGNKCVLVDRCTRVSAQKSTVRKLLLKGPGDDPWIRRKESNTSKRKCVNAAAS